MGSLLFDIKLKRENKVYHENVGYYICLRVFFNGIWYPPGHAVGLRAVSVLAGDETRRHYIVSGGNR